MNRVIFDSVDEGWARCRGRAFSPGGGISLTQRSRAILWLTLAFWVSNCVFLMVGTLLERREQLYDVLAVRLALISLGLLLCYGMHLALEKAAGPSFRRKVIAAAILAPLLAEAYAWANYFAFAALDPELLTRPINWTQAMFTLGFWTWFFLAWAGLYLAVQYNFDVKEEERRSSELRELAHRAKLQALHNQVNPHFLFNSLNSISSLIADHRAGEADQMLAKLGHFFRLTLAIDPMRDITLEEELALQQSYLDIEQFRYPDLQIQIDVPDVLKRSAVPALILQPIVENAVKYGVAGSPPPSSIVIRARGFGQRLRLEVTDSGCPSALTNATGAGVGLKNVRDRLLERFGDDQSFAASHEPSGGFRVTIDLPLEVRT